MSPFNFVEQMNRVHQVNYDLQLSKFWALTNDSIGNDCFRKKSIYFKWLYTLLSPLK